MMNNDWEFRLMKPEQSLSDYVESFWLLHNQSNNDKAIVILPDGRLDLIFSRSLTGTFEITLSGLETHADTATLKAGALLFAVSFKLPAIEYIFHKAASGLLDSAENLPVDFWDFSADDLQNFSLFCEKASHKILSVLPGEIDARKLKLFELIYASQGSLTVKELSEKVYWSSRQINRYFQQQYGISLKGYCNILRFRASLEHIAKGRLFPELNFTDQSHFIKEVKRFSGVVPKELLKNKNDRFIQFSTLASK